MSNPTTRVLALLELLQSQGQISGRELAQRLEVDGRTLRRYISSLEELGIPLTTERGRHGGYRLVAGFKLPPMMFSPDEAQAIALGLLAARSLGLSDSAPALASAQAKLERVMPAALQQRVRALGASATLDLPRSRDETDHQLLDALASATQARLRVRLTYATANQASSEREVDPYGLVYRWGLWYLSGFCHLRGDLRSFRLERIQALQPLDIPFERPADFDAAQHLSTSIANLPRRYPLEVQLLTDLHSATLELEGDAGMLVPNAQGVRLTSSTDSLTWFARKLARLSFDFRVIGPPELNTALHAQGQRLLRLSQ